MDQRKAGRDLTLEEFLEKLPEVIEAFTAATRMRTEDGDPAFPVGRSEPLEWWMQEMAAYIVYTELEEEMLHRGARGTKN